jgi:hypothetical protein
MMLCIANNHLGTPPTEKAPGELNSRATETAVV